MKNFYDKKSCIILSSQIFELCLIDKRGKPTIKSEKDKFYHLVIELEMRR